jgi:hypothetical protein
MASAERAPGRPFQGTFDGLVLELHLLLRLEGQCRLGNLRGRHLLRSLGFLLVVPHRLGHQEGIGIRHAAAVRPEGKSHADGKQQGCRRARGQRPFRAFAGCGPGIAALRLGLLYASVLAKQLRQLADMRPELSGKGIDPLRARDEQLERRRGLDIGEPNDENRLLLADGALDLAGDEGRAVGALRQHQTNALALSMPLMISSP